MNGWVRAIFTVLLSAVMGAVGFASMELFSNAKADSAQEVRITKVEKDVEKAATVQSLQEFREETKENFRVLREDLREMRKESAAARGK